MFGVCVGVWEESGEGGEGGEGEGKWKCVS